MSVRWAVAADGAEGFSRAAENGFESVELSLRALVGRNDRELTETADQLGGHGLSADCMVDPLPDRVRVTEQGFNLYVWTEYLRKSIAVASRFGCRSIAWVDGSSRRLPVEGDTSDLRAQLLQFVALFCDAAAGQGMSVLIEPLGPERTNTLNSLGEVAELIAQSKRENLKALVSYRELSALGAENREIGAFAPLIGCVHVENPVSSSTTRVAPLPDDGCDYRPFFRALRAAGYDGVVALPADASSESLRYCRSLWLDK